MHLALNYQRVEPSRGGAETYVADLCHALARVGHRVDLYAETWSADALPPEVNVVKVEAPGRSKLERLWNFADHSDQAMRRGDHECSVGFINTWAHDVIIPQGGVQQGSVRANSARFSTGLHAQAYRLAKAANPKFWVHRAIERRQYDRERTARYVAVSRMVRRHLEEFHQVPRSRIHVVPNAIDLRRIDVPQPGALRCGFRNRMGFEPRDVVGLFVGHNFALKGLRPLIAAMGNRKRLDPSGRPLQLLVCGSGNKVPYQRLAHRLGIADRIHFLGFLPDIREAYWSSDFFVQPSYYDPCSLVVLEALACGLPVITTEQNGAGELMTDGVHGAVLSSPRAEVELIDALDRMADDRSRREMAGEARELGRRQTFDIHVERLLAVFAEAAEGKKERTPHSGKWSSREALGARAGRSRRAGA